MKMGKQEHQENEHIIIMDKVKLNIVKFILATASTIALTFCSENLSNDGYISNHGYSFVKHAHDLDGMCFLSLEKALTPLYIEENSKDSILSISLLDARLFDKHYSKEENNRFLLFSAKMYKEREDSVINYFFGIDKKHSELVFLNFLVEFDILTVDHHEKVGYDFTFLNDCVPNSISKNNISEAPIYYQNKTFDLSSYNVWVVDSISGVNKSESPFHNIDTFSIVNNEYIKFGKDSMSFRFEDYAIFIGESKNWILSSSYNYKIIYNPKSGFVFIKKIRNR